MKVAPFRALTHLAGRIINIFFSSVEMKVAPFRALTHFLVASVIATPFCVEMKVAPFRALTHTGAYLIKWVCPLWK